MMLSILENGKVIKKECAEPIFDYECDVLCVGAGSAGIYAADSARREGADVILCEISDNIGGMPVCGNVSGYYYGAGGGSYEDDDEKSKGDTVFFSNMKHWEQRQLRLTERLMKSGVKLLCRHSAIGLYFIENRVVGILAYDGERQLSIKAKITVDATSDGHLIRMTEVKKRYGRPSDGSFVPFGLFLQYTKDNRLYLKNTDSGIMDHYSAADFSKRTIMSHANAPSFLENCEYVNCALHTGVREGLTYEGEDSLLYENLLLDKEPGKILFWAYADLDRHGTLRATEEELFQNWWVIANLATVTISIPVPLGSVVPKDIKGLVTAGRCLCCDTYTQSAVRMNRDMFRMGECVGIAASMAALGGVDFLDIDYGEFVSRARKSGCYDGYSDRKFSFDNSYTAYLNKMKALGRTPDKKYANLTKRDFICEPISFDVDSTFQLLKTDAPGVAIWSCFVSSNKDQVKERLFNEMIEASDSLYKYNCAIALGLLGDTRSLGTLRQCLKVRDCFFFTDNRRSNQFRSAVAACLIGRLGDSSDIPLLFEILSPDEINKEMYHTLTADYLYHPEPDRNFVYFSMFTHSCVALYSIYKREGIHMSKLHSEFSLAFKDGAALRRITDRKPGEVAYEETQSFINRMLSLTEA